MNAFNLTRSFTWQNPEATLTFQSNSSLLIADNIASVLRDPLQALSRDAFVTVNLTAGNLYHFFAETSVFSNRSPAITIFDGWGYRLISIDGDDLTPGNDGRNADSVILFAPEVSGTYYVNITYDAFPISSGFYLEAWEDVGSDFDNENRPARTTVSLSSSTPLVVEGDAATTRVTFTVRRSGDLTEAQSVGWFVEGRGDRPAGADDFGGLAMPAGTVEFAVGQATASITVDVRGDTQAEYDETFAVRLFEPSFGLRIGTSTVETTIRDNDSRAWLETPSLSATEGTGTGGTFTFTVRANAAMGGPHQVRWLVETTDITRPVTARDFAGSVLPSGILTFSGGESSQTVTITFAGDATAESDERFRIRLESLSSGLKLGEASSAVVQILDDDRSVIDIAALAAFVDEGNGEGTTVTFEVTRTNPNTTQTIDWVAGGLSAADFADGVIPNGRLVFAAGEGSKVITLRLRDDGQIENTEVLKVTISSPASGTEFRNTEATVTVRDDDGAFGASAIYHAREGSAPILRFVLERDSGFANVATVRWQAEAGNEYHPSADASDFVGNVWPGGTATFIEGSRFAMVDFEVRDDALVEPDEWFTIRFSDPTGGLTINPENEAVTAHIFTNETWIGDHAFNPQPHFEGDGAPTTLTIPIYRQGDISSAETFSWQVTTNLPGYTGGLATRANFAGGALPSGQVTFAAGEWTTSIALSIASDNRAGPAAAAFAVEVTSPRAGVGADRIMRIIAEDDIAVSIQSAAVQLAEGHPGMTPFTFTVTRTGGTLVESTVDWHVGFVSTGTSADVDDFGGAFPSGTLVFAPGETEATITVDVAGDRIAEAAERFAVVLDSASPGVTITRWAATGTILPDDTSVSITPYNAVKKEGHPGDTTSLLFTVARIGSTDAAQSVAWSVAPTGAPAGTARANAEDFVGGVLPSGLVEFAAGETRKIITVQVAGDSSRENDEGFAVRLASPSNGLQIGEASAVGMILRDETVMAITTAFGDATETAAASTPFTFTVTRSGVIDVSQTATWSVVNYGTNRAGSSDFVGGTTPRGTLRFEAGETTKTITIQVANDTAAEKDETFAVKLLNASEGVVLSPAWTVATIRNDDTTVGITALSASKAEGNAGTTPFTFTLTRAGVLDVEQSVSWAAGSLGTNRATAADFLGGVLPAGTVTFNAGETQKIITLDVLGDTVAEAAEAFIVRLSAPTNGLLINGSSANGLIANDDVAARMAADWVL